MKRKQKKVLTLVNGVAECGCRIATDFSSDNRDYPKVLRIALCEEHHLKDVVTDDYREV